MGNATPFPMTVGVQFADPAAPCVPAVSMDMTVPPYGVHTFTPPPGMIVMRAGASVGTDIGWEYSPCGAPCGPSAPGVFTFNWSFPACNGVKISM